LRKKKHVGEFETKGFGFFCVVKEIERERWDEEFWDGLVEFLEAQHLYMGGGGSSQYWDVCIGKYVPLPRATKRGRHISCTDEDRLALAEWCDNHPYIEAYLIGSLQHDWDEWDEWGEWQGLENLSGGRPIPRWEHPLYRDGHRAGKVKGFVGKDLPPREEDEPELHWEGRLAGYEEGKEKRNERSKESRSPESSGDDRGTEGGVSGTGTSVDPEGTNGDGSGGDRSVGQSSEAGGEGRD